MSNVVKRKCLNCGVDTDASSRCTNGHCPKCHAWCCTDGGATYSGHGLRVFAVEAATGLRCLVQAQVIGNFAIAPEVWSSIRAKQSPQESEAALAGSMFGWHCPAADPDSYDEQGRPHSRRSPKPSTT